MNDRADSSLRLRPFFWTGLGLFVLLAVVAAACRWMTPAAKELEAIPPPQTDPRWNNRAVQLQVVPPDDLRRLQAEQEAALHRSDAGHLPIEEAMRRVASGRAAFPSHPVSPEAMRASRAAEPPPAP